MTQVIDPVKLKAAAEHLEWALRQYPDSEEVQALLSGLMPFIEDAKEGRVSEPMEKFVPSSWAISAEGMFRSYRNPNIEDAYVHFATEMEGGFTKQDRERLARLEAIWCSMKKEGTS